MAKPKDPEVRALLLSRAAHMLRLREPLTLRSLVNGTRVSTMAVYTHFGSMEGMWTALRQEGFTQLETRFATVPTTKDPVRDLTALVVAYVRYAMEQPDVYRVMFDADVDLEDAQAADDTLEYLVRTARARDADRFRADIKPLDLAIQTWALGHGLASLVATGPLPVQTLDHGSPMLRALFIGAGDRPDQCTRSVERAWKELGTIRDGP